MLELLVGLLVFAFNLVLNCKPIYGIEFCLFGFHE